MGDGVQGRLNRGCGNGGGKRRRTRRQGVKNILFNANVLKKIVVGYQKKGNI